MPERPDLSGAKIIGFDIETYDPELEAMGNGVYRRDGNILGVSFSVDGFKEYYGLRHAGISAEERAGNEKYIQEVLKLQVPKVGANTMYDIDWLENWAGWKVNGKIHDVQFAEPLLDEYRGEYSLEALAQSYLEKGKTTSSIEQYNHQMGFKEKPIKNLYRMPYAVVRDYAMDDADEARLILEKQLIELNKQELGPLYEMEIGLIRPLMQIRKQGVRVNTELRDTYIIELRQHQAMLQAKFDATWGNINVSSGAQIAPIFNRLGIEYGFSEKGNPCFDKDFLLTLKDKYPIAKDILDIRETKQCLSTFFEGSLTRAVVQGRIHGEFVPNKQDDAGTVTGRMSARNPNLQQITSPDRDKNREEPLGKMCRQVFSPEDDCDWLKIDYSQIEYRVITHFAALTGAPKADEMQRRYIEDPHTDFHEMAIQWAREIAGVDLSRSRAKNLGFGSAYFMGINTMMKKFSWSREDATELNRVYFLAFPFIEPTRKNVVKTGDLRGYVKTPLGRRAHVTAAMRGAKPRPKTYIIFNHLIQGTAADILKASLVNAYKAGILDVLPMHVIVHDEFGASMAHTKEAHEAARELKNIMENSVKLCLPIVADPEVGPTWGEVKECDISCLD